MKHKFFRLTALLLTMLTAAALSACGGDPSSVPAGSSAVSSDPSASSSQPEESSALEEPAISPEDAETLAKERVPLDFSGEYTLSPVEGETERDGKSYYQFSVTGGENLTVLVGKEDGSVLTRYPDGTTYAVEEDPAFQITPTQWGGIYATEDGNVLTIDLIDNNSFEFTLTAGDDALKAQVARLTAGSPTQAEFIGENGVRLRFAYLSGAVRITSEDSAGAAFEGNYSPER